MLLFLDISQICAENNGHVIQKEFEKNRGNTFVNSYENECIVMFIA